MHISKLATRTPVAVPTPKDSRVSQPVYKTGQPFSRPHYTFITTVTCRRDDVGRLTTQQTPLAQTLKYPVTQEDRLSKYSINREYRWQCSDHRFGFPSVGFICVIVAVRSAFHVTPYSLGSYPMLGSCQICIQILHSKLSRPIVGPRPTATK